MKRFSDRIVRWQRQSGRHGLPWQATRDPYRIWLSEIMLQQTQVTTVIPYYERFLQAFPNFDALARASEEAVLERWSGLGYYSRARNLHRAARMVAERFHGVFPQQFEAVTALPGVGRSTAAAICAFAFGERRAILDGNVKRVLARFLGVAGYPGEKKIEAALWREAEARLPERDIEAYTQGLMDLGAIVCVRSRPRCEQCPLRGDCIALRENRVAELPVRKPAKALPLREVVMLMLVHRGEVMLEKRPPTGVWGGLWSLPELAVEEDVATHCRLRLGLRVRRQKPWDPLHHGFTHYKLKITPQPVTVLRRAAQVAEAGRLWLPVEDAVGAAVPAPVRTLLRRWAQSGEAACGAGKSLASILLPVTGLKAR